MGKRKSVHGRRSGSHRRITPVVWVDDRAFAPYWLWESYKQKFYNPTCNHTAETIEASRSLLQSGERFASTITALVKAWPISSAVHLSNASINRRAWLGQSACYVNHGACVNCTKLGWRELSQSGQGIANAIAESAINLWLRNSDRESFRRRSGQLVFPFYRRRASGLPARLILANASTLASRAAKTPRLCCI